MVDALFYPRYIEQEGFVTTPGTTFYEYNPFGGNALDANEEYFARIMDVDIPAGATITAAYIDYKIVVKDAAVANGFTYQFYYESNVSAGTSLHQSTIPFAEGLAEDSSFNRNWVSWGSTGTFTWTTGVGDTAQTLSINVTSLIQNAINTNAGRHCSFSFKMKCLTETGEVTLQNAASQNGGPQPATLRIQYTGGTARNEVVNLSHNSNFTQYRTGDRPAYEWYNNSAFGTFTANPIYSVLSSDGSITAPQGGRIYKVEASEDHRIVAYHRAFSMLIPGEWYTWSGYVYVPAGVSDVQITSPGSLNIARAFTTTKDAWVRLNYPYIHAAEFSPFFGFASTDPLTTGQAFYIANVNFTLGRQLYPYLDGNATDSAEYHRTFDWGGGTLNQTEGGVGFVSLTGKPTVDPLSPQPSGSTQAPALFRWTYNDPDLEGNFRVRAEIRKKRVP